MKRYFRVTLAVLFAVVAASCQKKAEYERPLGLISRLTKLTKSAGDTPVIVYSNTDWSVSLTSRVTWAGLDRLSDHGCSQVHFCYSENFGRARKVGVAFEAAGVRDTVFMVQAAGQTDPVLQFVSSSEEIPVSGGTMKYALNSNLFDDIADVAVDIRYHDEAFAGWLEVSDVTLDEVTVAVLPNGSGTERGADIVLSHTDGEGETISTWVTVRQPAQ